MIEESFIETTEEKRKKRHRFVYAYLLDLSMAYSLNSGPFLKVREYDFSLRKTKKEEILLKQMKKDIDELTDIYNQLKSKQS